jgi:hypothetical protein
MSFDKRIHFIPEAHTVILIPNSNDRLILHQVDINKLLDASEVDYFFVKSTPKITAQKGAMYSYPIEVRSKQLGVKFRVEAGPSGMKVNEKGEVTWQVPSRLEDESVDAIIAISNSAGDEILHNFRISIPANNRAGTGRSSTNRPPAKK